MTDMEFPSASHCPDCAPTIKSLFVCPSFPAKGCMDIEWQWCTFGELSLERLYTVLAAREAVFIVEQTSIYQDLDGLDLTAMHLIGWAGSELAAYLRVLGPNTRYEEPSIGRVLIAKALRGSGLGRVLFGKGVEYTQARYPRQTIRIGAQAHLQKFYGSFGFVVDGEPYIEDGIPHVQMLRA
jgi:ElaA protein